jgi:hypothetical protein
LGGAEEARTVFSAAHMVYIPLCVLVGVVLGWVLGSRSARAEIARLQRLLADTEERDAAQRMSLAGTKGLDPGSEGD